MGGGEHVGLYHVLNVGFLKLERDDVAVHAGEIVEVRKLDFREADEADAGEGGGGWWWGGGERGGEGEEGDGDGVVAVD